MNRTGWLVVWVLVMSAGVANGQSVSGQYVVEAPALIPIPPAVVVQPPPVVVQRPTLIPRRIPVVALPAPVVVQPAPVVVQRPTIVYRPVPIVAQPAPVVVQRVPIETTTIAQPTTASHSVWYSAPAASIAPSLTATPAAPAVCCVVLPVHPTVVSYYPSTTSAVITGVAPSIVYRPVVNPVALPTQYYVGSGIVGQPKVYVQGQPVRNALRYVSP